MTAREEARRQADRRKHELAALALDIAELCDRYDTSTWVQPEPTREKPHPKAFMHEVHAIGLIAQLRAALDWRGPSPRADSGGGGRQVPGSRIPLRTDVLNLLAEIDVGARELERRAMEQFGGSRPAKTTAEKLRRLGIWADGLDEKLLRDIRRDIRSWIGTARLALTYVAPLLELKEQCPNCGQESLVVRSDATGDIWCTNVECHDENGRECRWPRSEWLLLLTTTEESA